MGPICQCAAGACMNNTLVYEVSSEKKKKQERKLITNTELYRRESLVGNGITRAFNWMGLTFAEQGVVAFVSVLRHNLLPYTCIMLHWLRRGSFLPQEWKLAVTLDRVFAHFSVNGQLAETSRSGSGEEKKKSISVINRPTHFHLPMFEDILDYQLRTNVTRAINQFKWIFKCPWLICYIIL